MTSETPAALRRLLSRVEQMYEDWPTLDAEIEADIAQAKVALEKDEALAAPPAAPTVDLPLRVVVDFGTHYSMLEPTPEEPR